MTQYEGIGVQALEAYEEPLRRLQGYTADGVIDEREQRPACAAVAELVAAHPLMLVAATTLQAIGQMAHVGVLRYPTAPLRRQVAEVAQVAFARTNIKPLVGRKKRAARPVTTARQPRS
jgi:hypothetical protein